MGGLRHPPRNSAQLLGGLASPPSNPNVMRWWSPPGSGLPLLYALNLFADWLSPKLAAVLILSSVAAGLGAVDPGAVLNPGSYL